MGISLNKKNKNLNYNKKIINIKLINDNKNRKNNINNIGTFSPKKKIFIMINLISILRMIKNF